MKQQVLKALANPSHLFYVPYTLAILNFMVQFGIFTTLYIIGIFVLGTDKVNTYLNPLYFLGSVIVVHLFLASFSKRDAQLGQILVAKIKLFKEKIPKRIPA